MTSRSQVAGCRSQVAGCRSEVSLHLTCHLQPATCMPQSIHMCRNHTRYRRKRKYSASFCRTVTFAFATAVGLFDAPVRQSFCLRNDGGVWMQRLPYADAHRDADRAAGRQSSLITACDHPTESGKTSNPVVGWPTHDRVVVCSVQSGVSVGRCVSVGSGCARRSWRLGRLRRARRLRRLGGLRRARRSRRLGGLRCARWSRRLGGLRCARRSRRLGRLRCARRSRRLGRLRRSASVAAFRSDAGCWLPATFQSAQAFRAVPPASPWTVRHRRMRLVHSSRLRQAWPVGDHRPHWRNLSPRFECFDRPAPLHLAGWSGPTTHRSDLGQRGPP